MAQTHDPQPHRVTEFADRRLGPGLAALALSGALLGGLAGNDAEAGVLIMACGVPAGSGALAGAWRWCVAMGVAYGAGRVLRFLAWALFTPDAPPPPTTATLAVLACLFGPGMGAVLGRLVLHLERLR